MDATSVPPLTSERRWQTWFLAGLGLLFLGVSVQYTIKVGGDNDHRSAFLRWRESLLHLDRGVQLYDEYNYPNPPIMALLLRPVAILPPLVGSLAWFYLKVVMAFLVFHWVFLLVDDPARPFPVWAKMTALVLSMRPIISDLTHGNINIFILFLVVGALVALRGRRDIGAGLLLGLAIACKVTPALFVPYLLWKRTWRALAGCVAGLVLFLWVVPGLFLGLGHNQHLLEEWAEQMIVPYLVEGRVTTEHQNQSLPGLVYRLTTHGASFSDWDDRTHSYFPVEYHNVLDLAPAVPGLFIKLCMLAFAGLVVWTCRTPSGQRTGWRRAAEYGLIVVGMLLFSERTWKHHCVSLVLVFAVLLYALSALRLGAARRVVLIATLAAVVLLIGATSSGLFGTTGDGVAKLAQVYGAYMWAHLALVAALIVVLRLPASSPAVYQPPHDRLLRGRPESSTVTAASMDFRQWSTSHGQQTQGLRHPSDPRGRSR
jgi:hypothetical protein